MGQYNKDKLIQNKIKLEYHICKVYNIFEYHYYNYKLNKKKKDFNHSLHYKNIKKNRDLMLNLIRHYNIIIDTMLDDIKNQGVNRRLWITQ